jgi:hypothetical protein
VIDSSLTALGAGLPTSPYFERSDDRLLVGQAVPDDGKVEG